MAKSRITDLTMTTEDVLVVMSGGNPGALTAMMAISAKTKDIDPDCGMGGLGVLLSLDTHSIYDSRIWQLYSDVCKNNIHTMLGLLRAVQLGFLSESKLNHGIDNYGSGLDVPELLTQVSERLPNFKMAA